MATLIPGKKQDLEGFSVTRILPSAIKRMVGPFVFLDHMGPVTFPSGEGIDVRPHPHIGLATITYLLEGSLLHRDSLGNNIEIHPGDVNWMTAGKGIVHSEREAHEAKAQEHRLNGMQCWLALPKEFAEVDPSFHHFKKAQLPHYNKEGVFSRLIVGEAYGMTSPIKTYSPMFYLDVIAKANQWIDRPDPNQECAAYVLQGDIKIGTNEYKPGDFILLDDECEILAVSNARLLLYGGDRWDELPHLFWNFVSFSKERIEQAKDDWVNQKFPAIPGDCKEFTPLPVKGTTKPSSSGN